MAKAHMVHFLSYKLPCTDVGHYEVIRNLLDSIFNYDENRNFNIDDNTQAFFFQLGILLKTWLSLQLFQTNNTIRRVLNSLIGHLQLNARQTIAKRN
jgi:hypothetical protein